jgi:cell division protein FtsW (lipid II flippase)
VSARSPLNLARRAAGAIRRLPLVSGPITAVLALLILFFWQHNAAHLLRDTAAVVSHARTDVRLSPGQTVTIGRRELMQGEGASAGEAEHVAFTLEPGGRLVLRNVARQKRLWLDYAQGAGSYSARWRLQAGDVVATPGLVLRVFARDSGRVSLQVEASQTQSGQPQAGQAQTGQAQTGQTQTRQTQPRPAPQRVDIALSGVTTAVTIDGAAPPSCATPSWLDEMRASLRGLLARDDRGEDRVIELGGQLTCQVRDEVFLAAPALPFRAFNIVTRAGEFFVAPGDAVAGVRQPIQFRRGNITVADFGDIAWELDPDGPETLSHLIIGRTRYAVEVTAAGRDRAIALTPVSKLRRLTQVEAQEALDEIDNPAVKVTPTTARQPFSAQEMPNLLAELNGAERLVRLGLAGLLLGLAALGAVWRLREARGWGHLGAASLASAALLLGLAAAGLALSPEAARLMGQSLAFEQSLRATILAYLIASAVILLSPAFGLASRVIWLATLGLIALGSLTLLSLAVDSPRTDFAAHVHKNKMLFVDIVPIAAVVIATLPASLAAAWPRSFFAGGRWFDGLGRFLPSLAMLAGLAAWAVLGTETGVAGFQPVELGKAALVLLLAHVFAGFLRIDTFYGQRQYLGWLAATIVTALVFFLFLTAVPFLKSDYSPILIILITTVALAFSFLLPGVIQRIGAALATLRKRRAAPQPRFRQLGWPRGGALAGVLLVLLSINLALIVAFPALASKIIAGVWTIPKERMAAIEVLEQARSGPLRVPAERLLTWYDLDHGVIAPRGDERKAPNVLHRDLGLQLLFSKVALSHAPCSLSRLDLGLDRAGALGAAVTERLGPHPDRLICRLAPGWPVEGLSEKAEEGPVGASAAPGNGEAADPAAAVQAARFSVPDLLRVPVIQNDFIATYLLVRFGLPAGLALIGLQFLFVAGLVFLAAGLRIRRGIGFQDEAARTGLSIVVAGVATLFALHWLISWGNAIGVLPVMGQPMTLIAAATSHHLLMALPCIVLALIAGRVHAQRVTPVNRAPPDW